MLVTMQALTDRHSQKDGVIPDISDLTPDDDIALMEHPFFSLATKPDMHRFDYRTAALAEWAG